MPTVGEVLDKLKEKARPDQLEGMARYGMTPEGRLGVSIPDLRRLAKELGKNHEQALDLWKSGIQEARILAAMIGEPERMTEQEMERWVKDIDSWDVCDQVCMNLFERVPFVKKKIADWSKRDEEFVKRCAFSLIACLAWHDKTAADDIFIDLLPVILTGAVDERNFVKKSVSWALRHIGKRNLNLNRAALKAADDMATIDSKAARWIACDAIRELTSEAVRDRLNR
jgi:3-methyladenine DNA glycosylase AlkD